MWQNLRNVRSLAEKIGNVVAPVQADGDDYYEQEDEDGDEEEDENYEEEEEEEGEVEFDDDDDELVADAAPQQTTPRSPFGIVGFLARAMDNEQERYEGREKDDDDNDDHQDIVVEAQNDQHRQDHVEDHDDDDDEDQQPHAFPTGNPEEVLPPSSNFETSFVSVDDLDLPPPAPSEIPSNFESPHEPPKMLVLQRESGSLSPMSPSKKFVSVLPDSDEPPPPMIRSSSSEKATLKVDTPPETPRRSVDAVVTAVAQNASLQNSPIAKAEQGPAHHSNDEPPNASLESPVRGASSLRTLSATSSDHGMDSNGSRTEKLEKRCKGLKRQLKHAQEEAERLRQSGDHDQLYRLFQEKEARLLEASNEEHEMEMRRLRQEMDETCQRYQQSMIEERTTFSQEHEQMNALLRAANARNKELERENQKAALDLEKAYSGQEQQHVRALRKVEDRLAQLMATVDERDERIVQLQRKIKDLESHISKDRDGANEAEEELEELHQENETLHGQLDEIQSVNEALKKRLTALENGADELVRVKMELRMLREEHNRVQTKAENVVASAVSNTAQLEQDRDEALAEVNDLQLRLSSVMADLEIVKADSERLVLSNNNLQVALEAFQSEREAEMAMIEERKTEERDAVNAAHAAELDALKLVLQNELRQVQKAADDAVRNTMEEVKELEGKLENLRVENVQTRRALDEAIDRLSQTQDDVVDRTVMKNILLDWLTKAGKKERSQVLEMMADLLHFTDDEKRRVHIDGRSPSIRNIMSPPPAKVDMKNLEGENVREKWVNFLLAESDDA